MAAALLLPADHEPAQRTSSRGIEDGSNDVLFFPFPYKGTEE